MDSIHTYMYVTIYEMYGKLVEIATIAMCSLPSASSLPWFCSIFCHMYSICRTISNELLAFYALQNS